MNTNTKPQADIKLLAVDHIALNVTDLDRTEKFYQDVLGFQTTQRSSTRGGNRHIEMEAGPICLALFEMPDLDLSPIHEVLTHKGYFHMAFEVEDRRFDEVVETLKAQGVRLDGEPRNHGGGPSVYFFDPDGYQIELHANRPR